MAKETTRMFSKRRLKMVTESESRLSSKRILPRTLWNRKKVDLCLVDNGKHRTWWYHSLLLNNPIIKCVAEASHSLLIITSLDHVLFHVAFSQPHSILVHVKVAWNSRNNTQCERPTSMKHIDRCKFGRDGHKLVSQPTRRRRRNVKPHERREKMLMTLKRRRKNSNELIVTST